MVRIAGLTLVVALVGSVSLQAQATGDVIPGQKVGGSRNIKVLGHLPLDSAYKTADITIEQELSRPYVYVAHRLIPSGVEIISIKDPSKPTMLWTSFVKNAELHKGAGSLNPMYLKSHGRYYLTNSYQFQQGGPNVDLGGVVWDVTGLPDTSKIKMVAEMRDPEYPGGFHESYAYKHSNGQALLVTQASGPFASVWDIDQVAAAGKGDPQTGLVGRVPVPVDSNQVRQMQAMMSANQPQRRPGDTTRAAPAPAMSRIPGYHDFYIAYDAATHQDKFYGAGLGGFYVYDITDLKNPKLLTSITGVAGITYGHTFMADPTGRYAWTETEYQYAPLRVFDLKPGLDGTTKTISRPIGAWNADWKDLAHNFEIRWPYVFVSAYEDGLQVVNMMDPTNPYTVGYYYTCGCPHGQGLGSVMDGAWGVQVRNADGLIVISDIRSGFWSFKMEGFDGWNGHQWGMPNISSVQDWDNGPEGAPKPQRVS